MDGGDECTAVWMCLRPLSLPLKSQTDGAWQALPGWDHSMMPPGRSPPLPDLLYAWVLTEDPGEETMGL